ncbi:MAG: hypothetical protein KA166_04030, partial [Saprospiraceae bacterium]|nr:hypothetical protein [Saprospiraceae bacterium]
MNKFNLTILQFRLLRHLSLMSLFILGSLTSAKAVITLTFTSPNTMYTPGQVNNLSFQVTGVGSEWVDRLTITFPAGVTVNAATPNGTGGCATQVGVRLICSPSVSWCTATGAVCGTGAMGNSFCGFWQAGAQNLTADVMVPPGFTGPMVITLNSKGESGGTDVDMITLAQVVPAVPCEIVCPDNITYNLDPGACEQIINWNPPTTTGDCAVPVLEPGTVSQNNSETAVDDALGCTGAGDRHVRAYDLIEEGIAGDFQMTSLRMSAWNSGTVQVR